MTEIVPTLRECARQLSLGDLAEAIAAGGPLAALLDPATYRRTA